MEILTDGLRFPEGPVVLPNGDLAVVEIEAGQITRIKADGTKNIIAKVGGGPNGMAIGPDGYLYICNNGGFNFVEMETPLGKILFPHGQADDYAGGSIQRVNPDSGEVQIIYTQCNGRNLCGPNDIIFDEQGGFWFTDHGKNDGASRKRDIVGVFYAKIDGSHIEEVIFPMENPNGIGLSPDGKRLYVAETYTCALWAFDVVEPGKISPVANLAGNGGHFLYRPEGYKYFDSLGVENEGNICVATIGTSGISVISPMGELVEFVPTLDPMTTNICWGGNDMRDAYICLSGTGKILKYKWPRAGLKLNFA
ncbi:gluconolaconase [Sphingorhabdus lutea]|uniref:Gluconolaconase n=1 Tax=Sphingorhabdus lutea TaxID=1913578 RepID=A0A1L3J9V8_9SPHN|nr:SMP-30/gluconolactonase/LRE family protein [Sphingorhabdus lutea]APG61901.1 gluconolaconase [Sphingorhabdus lutea]